MVERSNKLFDCQQLEKLGVPIENLATDSRVVQTGDTFLAFAGKKVDARKLIPQAIAAGANAVIWDSLGFTWNSQWRVPSLGVAGLRGKAGLIADHVYGHPSRKLWVVGFTGTNGKTSCSHWYAQAMNALQKKTAVIGTLGNGFIHALETTAHTTPDAVLLQKKLAGFLQHGAENVAMEVSSHGIEQGRINGTTLSVAVLTNLSRDHLDYHKDMDAYAATKARLFFWPNLKYVVLNLDDILGIELLQQLVRKSVKVIGYGFKKSVANTASEQCQMIYGSNLKVDLQGVEFDIEYQGNREKLKADLVGKFNAVNLLAVVAGLLASGVAFTDAVHALRYVQPIAGRMEKFGGGDQPVVIVDYAHTPDALEKVLMTLREMLNASRKVKELNSVTGRLYCVLGCGGERDKGKRQLIGEVATRFADEVIFTSDNPRSEDPCDIINDMVVGVNSNNYQTEINRELAIYQSISSAVTGDIVLIAGKGHEVYQEIKEQKIPFSDAAVVQQILHDLLGKKIGQI
ncbi:UDP-N-acetylmuramoylalanyl-D-glutamate--2,6-diaminopimelate ligase [Nitrosomonas aestuarii]|uniref:UDP-N-acetylmuramoyl-L-alanyl-D-glutamate--2,6-diaminopimelate ligase n=1 Tax=Nitrosomonas aestuarii TaxID=52441 RepID=A0A1I3Z791_9PROT|nr:UDP-N-acetylmuramoyl-L-alanyl-D-glutamate--2,6-diaminopimelate ligase [Nitrosomonas aestuarii]SFK39429.1 UDP-N-acetylmuramoylalanyl-D-glutamate--2,6-diaminopimelate ligase [Nitrosomonas aestuarii]